MADEGWLDWKDWRRLEAANREDQVSEGEDEDEDEEAEGESLVGEDEDGRIFPTMMSLDSWRSLENAKRAGEKKREAMQAFTASDPPMPSSIPHKKKKKRRHNKHKKGGAARTLAKQKQHTAEATEALEAAQGEAVVTAAANKLALDAAQGEAAGAANESLRYNPLPRRNSKR